MANRKLTLANNPLLSGPALAERSIQGIPYREIEITSIDKDKNQPRTNFDKQQLQELSNSIKTYGVLSPLIVKPGKKAGRYQLVAGERRLRASKMAGLKSVPVLVNQDSTKTGENVLALQLVENLQRTDLTSLERAHAIGALKETHKLSIRQVAAKLGISKSMVQRSLEILELPDDLLNALKEGASESKILLLSKIDDEEIRAIYLKDLDTLTRQKIKSKMRSEEGTSKLSKTKESNLSPEDERIVGEIQRALGLKVKMMRSSSDLESGKLSIEFYSERDLQEIFRKLVANE